MQNIYYDIGMVISTKLNNITNRDVVDQMKLGICNRVDRGVWGDMEEKLTDLLKESLVDDRPNIITMSVENNIYNKLNI